MSEGNVTFLKDFFIVGFPGLHPNYYGLVSALLLHSVVAQRSKMFPRNTKALVYLNNTSNVQEFFLQGLEGLPTEHYRLVGTIFFVIYLTLVLGNTFVIGFVAFEKSLQKPTYIIFCNLAVADLGFGTTTVPRIIASYWTSDGAISFKACITQIFFVHYLGSCTSFLLGLMALDRFVAICNPLRYRVLINNSTVALLCLAIWTANAGQLGAIITLLFRLTFCGLNVVPQCYCDYVSMTGLACGDISAVKAISTPIAMAVLWSPLFFIIFSYVTIIASVMKMPHKEGRSKTFLTCTPQLFIIGLYYLPRSFVYIAYAVGYHFEPRTRVLITLIYSLLPALINPFIYCFRTKEMKDTLMRKIKQRWVVLNGKTAFKS